MVSGIYIIEQTIKNKIRSVGLRCKVIQAFITLTMGNHGRCGDKIMIFIVLLVC